MSAPRGEVIYLIGARGSGKTSVGQELSRLYHYKFMDLDHFLCEKEGSSIGEIVRENGWKKFRELEKRALREATASCAGKRWVIATGGGVVLDGENRIFLREHGLVFWLKGDAGLLHGRLCRNPLHGQRPALTGLDPLEEIKKVLKEREPLYASCAHHEIRVDGTLAEVCAAIGSRLGQH